MITLLIFFKRSIAYSLDRCALAGNEEAHHWGKLANLIDYLYTTRAPARACPIIIHLNGFKLLSEFAKVVPHVSSLLVIFLEQNQDCALISSLTHYCSRRAEHNPYTISG